MRDVMMMWGMRTGLALLIALATSACRGGDRGAGRGAGESDGAEVNAPLPLTPEESIAALEKHERNMERIRRRVRTESGADDPRLQRPKGDDPPAPPEATTYAECAARASRARDAEERELLMRPCRVMPGAP